MDHLTDDLQCHRNAVTAMTCQSPLPLLPPLVYWRGLCSTFAFHFAHASASLQVHQQCFSRPESHYGVYELVSLQINFTTCLKWRHAWVCGSEHESWVALLKGGFSMLCKDQVCQDGKRAGVLSSIASRMHCAAGMVSSMKMLLLPLEPFTGSDQPVKPCYRAPGKLHPQSQQKP